MDLVQMMNQIAGGAQKYINASFFSTTITASAIALAFLTATARYFAAVWRDGWERSVPALKDNFLKFMIVVALCSPMPFFTTTAPSSDGSGTSNRMTSFVGWYPKAVIEFGFKASELNPLETQKKFTTELRAKQQQIQDQATSRIKGIADNTFKNFGNTISSTWNVPKILLFIAVLIMFALIVSLPFLLLGFLGPPGWGVQLTLLCLVVAIALEISFGGAIPIVRAVMDAFAVVAYQLVIGMCFYSFTLAITFGFYRVLWQTICAAVAYSVTFPLSVLNMAFESRKQVFINNCLRGVAIGLTPIIAGLMVGISVTGMLTVLGSGSGLEQILKTYIGEPASTGNDIWPMIIDFFAWLFRYFFACFGFPSVVAATFVHLVGMSAQIAEYLVGATFLGLSPIQVDGKNV